MSLMRPQPGRDDGREVELRLPGALRRRMRIEAFQPGATIIRQGDPLHDLYVIAEGTVRVLLGAGDQAQEVARLGRGNWVGETALLTGRVSSTTVVAETVVRALAIGHAEFLRTARRDPSIFQEIATELAGRLRSSDDLIEGARSQRTVALFHTSGHSPLAERALHACERWAPRGFVAVIAHAAGDAASVADYAADATRLTSLRRRLASGHTAIVPAAEATGRELALFLHAVREFAPLVVVAAGDAIPAEAAAHITEALSLIPHGGRDAPLVELAVPHDTHPVTASSDAGSLARRICRQRIGLALGGGAARGFAHLGVLQALREADVPLDVLTGASIGSAVATGVAVGLPLDELGDTIATLGRWATVPHPLPRHSLFTAALFEMQLKKRFPQRRFEEIDMPLGIVAVDLDTAEEVLFTSGDLVPALIASMAIPGIYPPVRHHGRLLVDGGLLSPVPVRSCRDMGADIVISSRIHVDAGEQDGRRAGRKSLPWLPETIFQALDMMRGHIALESVEGVDVSVETRIPRQRARLFDFSHRAAMQQAGYMAARAVLPRAGDRVPGLRRAA